MRAVLSAKIRIIITCIAAIIMVVFTYIWMTRHTESTDNATLETHVAVISPRLSGYVISLTVVDNQIVKKGDILLIIDHTEYQHALDEAKAKYDSIVAGLKSAEYALATSVVKVPSEVESVQSQMQAAKAHWDKALSDLRRVNSLDDLVRSKQQVDEAVAAEKSTKSELENTIARVKGAQADLESIGVARTRVEELQALLQKASVNIKMAEFNLENTIIRAPFDGKVTQRGTEVGNFVQPGQRLMAVVGENYWVVANFKESQVRNMKPGQKAKIVIDAFPSQAYDAHIESIQSGTGSRFSLFPPENATGNYVKVVQRVPVKIMFDTKLDTSLPIGPGMSVQPTIYTR